MSSARRVRAARPKSTLQFESLEGRMLLAGTTLSVLGTKAADVIEVTLNQTSGLIEVRTNGVNPFPDNPNGFDPAGIEKIQINGLKGNDTIVVDAAIQLRAEILGEAGNDTITGGGGGDLIDGGAGHDSIHGGAGNDTIIDKSGNDTMDGGAGDDTINGGKGHDSILGSADDDELIGGAGHDTMRGADGDDDLSGDAGNDQLFGDADDDILRPGKGRDSLTGGAGVDMFGTVAKGGQRMDFNAAEDLEVSQVVMPDFSLPDLNSNSATFNQDVGPSVFRGSVSAYYFTHAG